MKTTKNILALAASLLFMVTLSSRAAIKDPADKKTANGDGFVVLELFTSEGCSSCPHADQLLENVQKQAGDKPIYILAYHIDYWDHQGWRDIFSSPQYTKRQYWYANKLNAQVYTPQVIVNGKTELIGSDETALGNAIRNSLQGVPATTLKLTGKPEAGKMAITYQASASKNAELMIAVVQKNAERQIKRGENGGRTLRHVQIVRGFQSFRLENPADGQITINLPKEFVAPEWEVIGFLQDKATGEIYAADKVVNKDTATSMVPQPSIK
ncbi:DUF1223 domain-containing protein [Dyadobacter fanqingshengii]|uniref:DUF1223 domain-containing protein n=1 Tax=Dyadobacter fanqingshengii TaxID=2906443 RepID=A0A9X1PBP7_9BACT|nr:DUF1223 domain-containing protein [Dyadobacter fanqingshengii]MCF0041582.1 DUF1223 domain-containing protein [Dyadobacter fanqingshengii]USJ36701.1 DUF1223 domain-containing protein [Dyadobacter fanqingshengii]